ncbi:MFS transporter [Streptococcus suis]|nr:MFS transporter [Streptococcus suis]
MKRTLEKISLLALSTMLVSTYSISSALPYMLEKYRTFSPEKVELLISLPSFTIMIILLSNTLLTKWLREKQMIVLGLLILGLAGMMPLAYQSYIWVFLSRLLLGVGIGLINAKAVSIISERFEGHEKVQMMGYRGSAEVVGVSFLTFLVGFLIKIAWYLAFAVYSFAFVVLLLYLMFVPSREKKEIDFEENAVIKERLSPTQWKQALFYAFLAGMGVFLNTVVNMRTSLMVTEMGMGTASQASLVLSLQQLIGIVSGILFAKCLETFGARLGGLSCVGLAVAYMGMGLATGFYSLGAMTILSGFFYSLIMTVAFQSVSDVIPARLINTATAVVLLGCNIGSAFTPYFLKIIGIFFSDNRQIFLFLAVSTFMLGVFLLCKPRKTIESLD